MRHAGRVSSTETRTTHAGTVGNAEGTPAWGLLPAIGVVASAVLLFGFEAPLAGYPLLWASVACALLVSRALARDLLLIAVGLSIVSTISVAADISYPNIVRMGIVLSLTVAVPWALERFVFRRDAIRFPVRTGRRWLPVERAYLAAVVPLGWLILPGYFVGSGAYRNWPAVDEPDEIWRLFLGVNGVGIWDELFFICTVFSLLLRHFPMWQANLLQAGIFVSFLWELGYREWGPAMTVLFALAQGYLFTRTRNLVYVVCVHLLFDLMVFLVIVHAHNPGLLRIFWL
jgi:hypothetical protein